jgi:excisionase family DNA binding protein
MSEPPPQPEASQFERLAAFLRLIPEGGALDRLLKGAAHLETPPASPAELSGDILHGAAAISHFLYGHEKHRRKVYRLVQAGKLPHFRLGSGICTRRSILMEWIARMEVGPL